MAFTDDLVQINSTRQIINILKALANLTRYCDITFDTYLHGEFTSWLKRKEIHWKPPTSTINNYNSAKLLKLEDVINGIKKLNGRYKLFAIFALVTGLRSEEAVKAFNHHKDYCSNGIMELFWDRRTKKTNAVYCHPEIHKRISSRISGYHMYNYLSEKKTGFQLRYLRKVNFTINATKLDPLLAEFMQGRRGNISQRHYYLPTMIEHRTKWLKVWKSIIKKLQFL